MDDIISIFCHAPNDMPEEDAVQELWRQHDQLAQEAARKGRPVEHCFFHVGEFNLEQPDKVLLRLMQYAQTGELGILLIENMDRFPLSHHAKIPQMKLFFVQENQQETLGSLKVRVEKDDDIPQHGCVYFGVNGNSL